MDFIHGLKKLLRDCRLVRTPFVPVVVRHFYFRLRGKNLLTSNGVAIYGLENITTDGLLIVGLNYVGFVDDHDRTLIRVQGELKVAGRFSIGKGCRLDIGKGAIVSLDSGYINPNTILVIMHGLKIGSMCAISWGCQFLDEDFHTLSYPNKPARTNSGIVIGDHVWVGSNVTILKGAHIPNGSVVASGAIVRSKFYEENTLIAGNPAKVVRHDISWR